MIEDGQLTQLIRDYLVAEIASDVRQHKMRFSDAPHLHRNGGLKRFSDYINGVGKGRVNFQTSLKAFMKSRFPDFSFKENLGDHHLFTNKSHERTLTVDFTKIHGYGVGKQFEVNLVIALKSANSDRFKFSLSECFDSNVLSWVYGNKDSLGECLAEVEKLLGVLLPAIQKVGSKLLNRSVEDVFSTLPKRDKLSCHQARSLAHSVLANVVPQANFLVRAIWTGAHARIDERGKLIIHSESRPSSHWIIELASRESMESIRVIVPLIGPIRYVKGVQIGYESMEYQSDGLICMPSSLGQEDNDARPAPYEYLDDQDILYPIVKDPLGFGLVPSKEYRLAMRLDANEQRIDARPAQWNVFFWMIAGEDQPPESRVNRFLFSAIDGMPIPAMH